MKFGLKRMVAGASAVSFACLLGVAVNGQVQPSPEAPPMAEQVFKNIQVMKGMPVNDFMLSMGVFSAALGMSCEDCHDADDRSWDGFAADNPRKQMARRMVVMMAAINKQQFGGRQLVTCYSCHRGLDRPRTAPDLVQMYGGEPQENPNYIIAQAPNQPTPAEVLDKYLLALGGAQRLAALTSYTATGKSVGFGPESAEDRPVEIFAKAPNQVTTIIRTGNGTSTTTIDGVNAWLSAPLRPVAVLPLTGKDLDGFKVDGMLAFPGQIKTALSNMRTGFPATVGDKDAQVLQGTTTPNGTVVTLYFDMESGLLVRQMRYVDSAVGPLVYQVDYEEYEDVAGVKIPEKFTHTWLNGREQFELSQIRPNVAIPATRFAKPAPSVAPPVKP